MLSTPRARRENPTVSQRRRNAHPKIQGDCCRSIQFSLGSMVVRAHHFSRTMRPIVYPEYATTSLIFASLSVFPGFVVMVTSFVGRSTLTVATSGCFQKVFSIPVAQKAQTIPLTVVVIVSAKAEPDSPIRMTTVNRI